MSYVWIQEGCLFAFFGKNIANIELCTLGYVYSLTVVVDDEWDK